MSQSSVTVGLGWLDGTVATPMPEEVRSVVTERFGAGFAMAPVGYYSAREGFDGGRVSIHWNGRANATGTTRVEVTQTALDTLGLDGSVSLSRDLDGVGFRFSRVDEWIDDAERRMTPELVRAAVQGGLAVTHARPGRHMVDDLTGRQTYYLGRPGSDRMARCYDREDGPTRYELQSRRHSAQHAMAVLLGSDQPVAALTSNVISFADYRESKRRDRAGTRTPRLPWWAAVVGDLASAEAAPSRPRPSLLEREAYFRTHWARGLAELYLGLGADWLNDVLRAGIDRMKDEMEAAS